ncbi:hypothetical protein CHLRE_01g014200v5 [Chlamydomonas reinhardtii]|uniref:Uncharacterized protein n=1 Tax=Chlamydomonas reinhardtii TaxID=3055 RepID=A0A2K3E5M9_CHLRE|nr:uncharacterized protein CHLRE_01g014200v5 [Chlamydomonas reinhardtii]PNW88101.1 hypothetical protein CHLRE_01g014200v5 [Chlamydomonas reinhardtii]
MRCGRGGCGSVAASHALAAAAGFLCGVAYFVIATTYGGSSSSGSGSSIGISGGAGPAAAAGVDLLSAAAARSQSWLQQWQQQQQLLPYNSVPANTAAATAFVLSISGEADVVDMPSAPAVTATAAGGGAAASSSNSDSVWDVIGGSRSATGSGSGSAGEDMIGLSSELDAAVEVLVRGWAGAEQEQAAAANAAAAAAAAAAQAQATGRSAAASARGGLLLRGQPLSDYLPAATGSRSGSGSGNSGSSSSGSSPSALLLAHHLAALRLSGDPQLRYSLSRAPEPAGGGGSSTSAAAAAAALGDDTGEWVRQSYTYTPLTLDDESALLASRMLERALQKQQDSNAADTADMDAGAAEYLSYAEDDGSSSSPDSWDMDTYPLPYLYDPFYDLYDSYDNSLYGETAAAASAAGGGELSAYWGDYGDYVGASDMWVGTSVPYAAESATAETAETAAADSGLGTVSGVAVGASAGLEPAADPYPEYDVESGSYVYGGSGGCEEGEEGEQEEEPTAATGSVQPSVPQSEARTQPQQQPGQEQEPVLAVQRRRRLAARGTPGQRQQGQGRAGQEVQQAQVLQRRRLLQEGRRGPKPGPKPKPDRPIPPPFEPKPANVWVPGIVRVQTDAAGDTQVRVGPAVAPIVRVNTDRLGAGGASTAASGSSGPAGLVGQQQPQGEFLRSAAVGSGPVGQAVTEAVMGATAFRSAQGAADAAVNAATASGLVRAVAPGGEEAAGAAEAGGRADGAKEGAGEDEGAAAASSSGAAVAFRSSAVGPAATTIGSGTASPDTHQAAAAVEAAAMQQQAPTDTAGGGVSGGGKAGDKRVYVSVGPGGLISRTISDGERSSTTVGPGGVLARVATTSK